MLKAALRHGLAMLAATAFLAAGGVGSARAGDYAERAILGFSPDGRYFAFEQFGVQDGSGFPFSEIFAIDLATDGWVDGTPVRVRIDDEEASLAQARQQAMQQAQPVVDRHDIRHAGRLLASAPVTEAFQDPHELSFARYASGTWTDEQRTVVLEILDLPGPAQCEGYGVDTKGFALRVRNDATNEEVLVHTDDVVPSSRGCTLDYGLSDIIAYPAFESADVLVLLVNVFSFGFEGPDRRYIAMPIPAP